MQHLEISRLRRAQVSFLFSQCSHLETVLISVFAVSGALRIVAEGASVFFVVFCFLCFSSRSYPVPHRDERVKQGMVHPRNIDIITSQNFCSVLSAYCYNSSIRHLN